MPNVPRTFALLIGTSCTELHRKSHGTAHASLAKPRRRTNEWKHPRGSERATALSGRPVQYGAAGLLGLVELEPCRHTPPRINDTLRTGRPPNGLLRCAALPRTALRCTAPHRTPRTMQRPQPRRAKPDC